MGLEADICALAEGGGFRLHVWKTAANRYQANVAEPGLGSAWTVHTDSNPLWAVAGALRMRAQGSPSRKVICHGDAEQPVFAEAPPVVEPAPQITSVEPDPDCDMCFGTGGVATGGDEPHTAFSLPCPCTQPPPAEPDPMDVLG